MVQNLPESPTMDPLDSLSLQELSARTFGHYEAQAEALRRGTRDHDVQQNLQALLGALVGAGPYRIHDDRPEGLPRDRQPWLASVRRRKSEE